MADVGVSSDFRTLMEIHRVRQISLLHRLIRVINDILALRQELGVEGNNIFALFENLLNMTEFTPNYYNFIR